jgi:hypothetical protein
VIGNIDQAVVSLAGADIQGPYRAEEEALKN